ncbi:MAG: hypothetical protein AAF968_13740 [Pseudomonadota bacterium]
MAIADRRARRMISREPIAFDGEWDLVGNEPNGDGFVPRTSDNVVEKAELPVEATVGSDVDIPRRGFLRVDLAEKLSVYSVHRKATRGAACEADDLAKAEQREVQAEGLVQDSVPLLAEDRTAVVAGGYDIQAPGRVARVWSDPAVDCAPMGVCGTGGNMLIAFPTKHERTRLGQCVHGGQSDCLWRLTTSEKAPCQGLGPFTSARRGRLSSKSVVGARCGRQHHPH